MSCSPKNPQPQHDVAASRIEVEHAGQQVWQQVADVSVFQVIQISDCDMQT
jgi:hypothetical protein